MAQDKRTDPFVKAEQEKFKLKIGLFGKPSTGKTYAAMKMATAIAAKEGGKIAFLDTDKRSSHIYANDFDFYVLDLGHNYSPDEFIQAIKDAQRFGYCVLVIDSLSPAWNREGGVLEIVDKAKMGNNKVSGWLKGRPAQDKLIDAIMWTNIHIIITTRAKEDLVIAKDKHGNTQVTNGGVRMIQSPEFEYELHASFLLDRQYHLHTSKSRCKTLNDMGNDFDDCNAVVEILHDWCNSGTAPLHVQLPAWITKGNIDKLFHTWRTQGLTDSDILLHAGIQTKYDLPMWDKYPTGQNASDAIKLSLAKHKGETPKGFPKREPRGFKPTTPPAIKTPAAPAITPQAAPPIAPTIPPSIAPTGTWDEHALNAIAVESINYGYGFKLHDNDGASEEALAALNKSDWNEFETPLAASLALREVVINTLPPLLTNEGIWRGKQTELLVNANAPSGGIVVKINDKAKITKLGEEWEDASEHWVKDKPITFHDTIVIQKWRHGKITNTALNIGIGDAPF